MEATVIPQPITTVPSHGRRPPLDFAPVALIADDDRVIRELCRDVLQAEALRVLMATNGQEALAIAEAWIPDVLVTDVVMPSLDGFGLVRALRRLYPEVPVIMITGDEEYDGRPIEEVGGAAGGVPRPPEAGGGWGARRRGALHQAVRRHGARGGGPARGALSRAETQPGR